MTGSNKRTLNVERLDDRVLLATSVLSSGVLTVTGSNTAETITIREVGGKIEVDGRSVAASSQVTRVLVNALSGNDTVDVRGLTGKRVDVNGGAGADTIRAVPATRLIAPGYNAVAGDVIQYEGILLSRPPVVAGDASVWTLDIGGGLWRSGIRQQSNVRDVQFDQTGRVLILDTAGTLSRSTQAYTTRYMTTMGVNVIKWQLAANNEVFALQRDNWLTLDGVRNWANQLDFRFDPSNRLVALQKDATYGSMLYRSNQPFGRGGWTWMATAPVDIQFARNGKLWVLESDNQLRVESQLAWANIREFALDAQDRVVQLQTNGWVGRSDGTYGNGGWVTFVQTGATDIQVSGSYARYLRNGQWSGWL